MPHPALPDSNSRPNTTAAYRAFHYLVRSHVLLWTFPLGRCSEQGPDEHIGQGRRRFHSALCHQRERIGQLISPLNERNNPWKSFCSSSRLSTLCCNRVFLLVFYKH